MALKMGYATLRWRQPDLAKATLHAGGAARVGAPSLVDVVGGSSLASPALLEAAAPPLPQPRPPEPPRPAAAPWPGGRTAAEAGAGRGSSRRPAQTTRRGRRGTAKPGGSGANRSCSSSRRWLIGKLEARRRMGLRLITYLQVFEAGLLAWACARTRTFSRVRAIVHICFCA